MTADDFLMFVPGPAEIEPAIRQVGAERLPYTRTPSFGALHRRVAEGLARLIETEGEVLVFTSSGTGAMEATILSVFRAGEKVLVVNGGTFGDRWAAIARLHGLEVEELQVEPGRDVNPDDVAARLSPDLAGVLVNSLETSSGHLYDIERLGRIVRGHGALLVVDAIGSFCADPFRMDAWGVDATVFSTQKGLALPPGLAFLGLGQRAADKARATPRRSYYFHAADYLSNAERGQAPFTIAISLMLQLEARLQVVGAQGSAALVAEHAEKARYFREAIADLPLSSFPERPSNAVTTLRVGPDQDAFRIVKRLEEDRGIYVAPNPEPLKSKVFRVGHFGHQPREHADRLVDALRAVLSEGPTS